MRSIIAKFDDDTVRELDELAKNSTRSEVLREAVRHYIAVHRIEQRRREVEEFIRSGGDREAMRQLAESDMDNAADLLRRVETNR